MVTQINHYHSRILLSRYIQKLKSIFLAATFILSLSFFSGNDIARADTFGCFSGSPEQDSAGNITKYKCDNGSSLPVLLDTTTITNSDGAKCVQGTDWSTNVSPDNSDITVLSIHGGNIELGTSVISTKLRDLYGWNRYNFNGNIQNQDCKDLKTTFNPNCSSGDNFCVLHITSRNFNDNAAITLVENNSRVVSIHGCTSPNCTSKTICIGGGAGNTLASITAKVNMRNLVKNYIDKYRVLLPQQEQLLTYAYKQPEGLTDEQKKQYPANSFDTNSNCADGILGNHPDNIVNQTSSGLGLQLEISKDIRDKLALDSIDNDLLRTIVYGGAAKGVNELPLPILATNGTETYTIGSDQFNRYKLKVQNKSEYSTDLFAASPNLPACGLNTNSSRTWVNIYNANGDTYIYGFCALGSPNDLDSIWFAVKDGSTPPAAVYITLEDRLNNRIYRSNRVKITP
jgi:phage replication-related protein YjqB (UPF0714/DUF867 family)